MKGETRSGQALPAAMQKVHNQAGLTPFISIYGLFGASLAAESFEALFLSIFGIAASTHRLADVGFICWYDFRVISYGLRVLLSHHHLLMEVSDGFGDSGIVGHVARSFKRCGASEVVIEDHARHRHCGDFDGQSLLPQSESLAKL